MSKKNKAKRLPKAVRAELTARHMLPASAVNMKMDKSTRALIKKRLAEPRVVSQPDPFIENTARILTWLQGEASEVNQAKRAEARELAEKSRRLVLAKAESWRTQMGVSDVPLESIGYTIYGGV